MSNSFCLSCGRKIESEGRYPCYHDRCLKKIFPSGTLPELSLDANSLKKLAFDSVKEGISVPGVQEKLSLHLEQVRVNETKLTFIGYPEGYILKPQSSHFPYLPEAENCVMCLADEAGIPTVPHTLIASTSGEVCYLTKRIDRIQKGKNTFKLRMEDFAQLSGTMTENKYQSSYEKCAKTIDCYMTYPVLEKQNLFYRLLFCFLTLNSDMHLKNFSLLENTRRECLLSPAYDLLPVNLIMKEDKEEVALTLHGKKRNLSKNDFLIFASSIGIGKEPMNYLLTKLLSKVEGMLILIQDSELSAEMKQKFQNELCERAKRLGAIL